MKVNDIPCTLYFTSLQFIEKLDSFYKIHVVSADYKSFQFITTKQPAEFIESVRKVAVFADEQNQVVSWTVDTSGEL